ncbi:hypothetical protein AYJ57_22935 (plasmid) [Salipiger sp. CCB-MM3]|uniref:GNAT family N-acetyltransferase n=1 Tax=Salipiger sp. CCB-MM3 TaxID=1792508 RepID=UPI00080AB535|nr:GNAT family N-acetyltransferase [Salipiger sp. CCB-MM3]ANT63329.1 hypothetical protein AYJ57_22935 [Salipiger sp. CCB-MM3]
MAQAEAHLHSVPTEGSLRRATVLLMRHWQRLSAAARRSRFQCPAGPDWLQRRAETSRPDLLLGLEADGETRAVMELYRAGDAHAEIALSVEDAYQGRGYGRRLFAAALDHAREMGVETVEATFSHDNRAMLQIALGAGAKIVSEHGNRCATVRL